MANLTRRSFLKETSAGAAALGLVPSIPLAARFRDLPGAPTPEQSTGAFSESVIAHVSNVATGEVTLLAGAREIVFRDRQLVARLIRAAR
jgi:hypothetical protein